MGWWSKVKRWIGVAEVIAPLIPKLPPKVKIGVVKAGEIADKVDEAIKEPK